MEAAIILAVVAVLFAIVIPFMSERQAKQIQTMVKTQPWKVLAIRAEGEIQFADREELSQIVKQVRANEYPVRSIIHHNAQSKLCRNK